MATHSSILVWEIPWTETGGLQLIGSQELDMTEYTMPERFLQTLHLLQTFQEHRHFRHRSLRDTKEFTTRQKYKLFNVLNSVLSRHVPELFYLVRFSGNPASIWQVYGVDASLSLRCSEP